MLTFFMGGKRSHLLVIALHEPYVLAFEPSFVEIRHIETGQMTQVIQGTTLRLLFADTPPSVTNSGAHHYSQQNPYGYVSKCVSI